MLSASSLICLLSFSDIKNLYIRKYNPIWSKAANISNEKKLTDGSGEKTFRTVPHAQQLIHLFTIKLLLIKKITLHITSGYITWCIVLHIIQHLIRTVSWHYTIAICRTFRAQQPHHFIKIIVVTSAKLIATNSGNSWCFVSTCWLTLKHF